MIHPNLVLEPSRAAAGRDRSLGGRLLVACLCLTTWVGAVSAARADVLIMVADLQSLAGVTQPGWNGMGMDVSVVASGTQTLQVTATGTALGVTASLNGGASWNSRGSESNRAAVVGTTFDDVVSDLWFNRQLTATLNLTGLMTGTQYTLQAWHNDSYALNEGAAAGGGTVAPSLVGGVVNSASNGTVTNLRGTQTNAAFGITTLVFTSTSSAAAITFTRNGGSFTGIPMSGIRVSTAAVPEPATCALALAGLAGSTWWFRRRFRRTA